jgi:hypothetical protein
MHRIIRNGEVSNSGARRGWRLGRTRRVVAGRKPACHESDQHGIRTFAALMVVHAGQQRLFSRVAGRSSASSARMAWSSCRRARAERGQSAGRDGRWLREEAIGAEQSAVQLGVDAAWPFRASAYSKALVGIMPPRRGRCRDGTRHRLAPGNRALRGRWLHAELSGHAIASAGATLANSTDPGLRSHRARVSEAAISPTPSPGA